MEFRRAAWTAFGYGMLAFGLLATVNAVRVVAGVLLGATPATTAVFFAMVSLGAALVVGTGGYVVLQRVRHPGSGHGANLDWGRVLGP